VVKLRKVRGIQICDKKIKGKRHIEELHAMLGYRIKMGLQGTKLEAVDWISL
jgi:hypothetical protein